jgi:uncharacterized protein
VSNGFRYLQFIPCIERDPATGGLTDYSVTSEAYGRFLCDTFDEWVRPKRPNVFLRLFDAFLITLVTGETPYCGFAKECGSYVVIEHNGDVYPCDFFVEPQWLLGNITQTPLEQILVSPRAKEFRSLKQRLAPECLKCEWEGICHGGCLKERITIGGKAEALNTYCSACKQFFAHSRAGFHRLKEMVLREQRAEEAKRDSPHFPNGGKWGQSLGGKRGQSPGRNDPCPCGSGKKYKKCCMVNGT